MTTETVSLHSFCKDHGFSKTSVRRWLIDNNFDTSNGLSEAAITAALGQFKPEALTAPVQPTEITFSEGNHRGHLTLPQQPETVDLGELRGENAALTSFEPDDIDRFLDACDGFLGAVDADYQHQRALTQQKEAAAAKVRSKVEQVKQASLLYQVRSEALSLHNRGLDAELKEGLSTLGKPAAATE